MCINFPRNSVSTKCVYSSIIQYHRLIPMNQTVCRAWVYETNLCWETLSPIVCIRQIIKIVKNLCINEDTLSRAYHYFTCCRINCHYVSNIWNRSIVTDKNRVEFRADYPAIWYNSSIESRKWNSLFNRTSYIMFKLVYVTIQR